MRCFISIPISKENKEKIKEIQNKLQELHVHVSWTRPESLHLTLKFLGNIEGEMVEAIKGHLDRIVPEFPPFDVYLRGTGVFPDKKRPRIIWIGIKEDGQILSNLYRRIEEAMVKLGFPREGRGFTPHITIGRIRSKEGMGKLIEYVQKEKDIDLGEFRITRVQLMKSQLNPKGAVYTELYSVSLKGNNS